MAARIPARSAFPAPTRSRSSLAAALELKRQLEAQRPLPGGADPDRATRSSRWTTGSRKAQAHGAALFVSMHADALSDHTVRGASVYTLADHGLGRADRGAGAAREQRRPVRRAPASTRSPEVARILASLVRQETRIGSGRLARSMVGSLDQDLPMLPNPERHAGFVVLKAADIPSVLVEMGFMSNPADEAELRRPQHRALVAEAMKRAVDGYFAAAGTARRRLLARNG